MGNMKKILFAAVLICALFAPGAAFCNWPIPSSTAEYIERAAPFREQVENILKSEGVPPLFFWLCIAESGGDPDNISPAGAAGLWQLMPFIARHYGLKVERGNDERFDIEKSTRAAAKYIKRNLKAFNGSILWAIAAYNRGGTNLKRITGYKPGMPFNIVKTKSYASYALARTVKALYMHECKQKNIECDIDKPVNI